ncbi:MAG TPA: hypothetical protein VJN88_17215 [Ktedonobacterales bacterium]|nr:hypothetical protein [Ktedonobacterales bacterium]
MTTCEQCGANTVDEQGLCHTCGWRARQTASDAALFEDGNDSEADDSPSLGETRAAEAPNTPAPPVSVRYSAAPAPVIERTTDMPRYAPTGPAEQRMGTRARTSAGGTGRFCGTCGARIVAGEMYCGQCGSPVGQATGTQTGRVGAPTHLGNGTGSVWSDGAGDEPTEAFVVAQQGYPRALPATGYPQSRYGQATNAPATPSSSRTMRVIFGVLCLAGSLVSAAAAVIVALQQGK